MLNNVPQVIDYLAIIPARGGSKRLPGKNIKFLNGKPLIAHSIEPALDSLKLTTVAVSTDDEAIASIAKEHGADVPFIRPSDIAGDTSSVVDALRHAVSFYEDQGHEVKAVVLLQVTSPFRKTTDIDKAIEVFEKNKADSVTTVSHATHHPYYAIKGGQDEMAPFFDEEKLSMQSHMLPPAVYENGAVYVVKTSVLKSRGLYGEKSFICQNDEPLLSVDIDTQADFDLAEFLIARGNGNAA